MPKIRKLGRQRPILYKGIFLVPNSVVTRLCIAKNHFELAQIAHFNGKINQYYMTIDNLLAAVITAKEGSLTTTNHKVKIEKFFTHLGRRAKIRRIEKTDLYEFYDLWADSRYRVYFPKSQVVEKLRLFTDYLFKFVTTEIARSFKSDESVLAERINNDLRFYQSCSIQNEAGNFHEFHQMEAEEIGERHGIRLGMKLANPWNFMEFSLISDRKNIIEIIDDSDEIAKTIQELLKNWDDLISKITVLNFERTALEIASAKAHKKSTIVDDKSISEAVENASKNADARRFRLVLDFSYDPSEPKRTVEAFTRMKKALQYSSANPNKAPLEGWELWKEYP